MDNQDYFRFIHNMFELNDENAFLNRFYHSNSKPIEARPHYFKERRPRELLVEILAFTLMPNHYHFILRQKKDKGIVRFLQKLGTGYAVYFNNKYERSGTLFQGPFKSVILNDHSHFVHLPFYVHSNPLDLAYSENQSPVEFLKKYRWSSYLDYIGRTNFPSVTSRDFFLEFFGGEEAYRKAMEDWVIEREQKSKMIEDVTIEARPR